MHKQIKTKNGVYLLFNDMLPMTCETIAYMKGNVSGDFSNFMGTTQWKTDFDEKFRKNFKKIEGVVAIKNLYIDEEKTKLHMVHIVKNINATWEDVFPRIEEAMKNFVFFDQKTEAV